MLEQPVPEVLHSVGMLEQFMEGSRGKDSHWKILWGTFSCGRGPTLEHGRSVRSPPHVEKGAAEAACDELTTALIPHHPALLGEGGQGREIVSKVPSGKKRGGEVVFVRLGFTYFNLTVICL